MLAVPTARGGDALEPARQRMLTETVLSGTPSRDSVAIAETLQAMGAGLATAADAEILVVAGSVLAQNQRRFLEVFSEVVREASFPDDEVALERDRLVEEIRVEESLPATVARNVMVRRLFGRHPYGRGTPSALAVRRVGAPVMRQEHARRVLPRGAALVLVGALDPDAAVDEAAAAFGPWSSRGARAGLAPPGPHRPGAVVVDRPGSVQTTIRLAGPAVGRAHPDYPKLVLANTILGGYFTSRLVENLRERRGYTYRVGSRIEHRLLSSELWVVADVATEVTGPALVEIGYELARMVAEKVTPAELDAARRYVQGVQAAEVQTQAGLAAYVSSLAMHGRPLSELRDFPRALESVDVDGVQEAATRWLAPGGLSTVLVGVAADIEQAVGPLLQTVRVPAR